MNSSGKWLIDEPNLDVPAPVDPRPDTQYVLPAPNTEHGAADFLARFRELVAHDGEEEVFPVPIGDPLFEPNDPFPAALVLLVLPDGSYPLAEEMIIGHGW